MHLYYLGYGGKHLLQDGVGLCFLRPVGLNLQAHGARSRDEPESEEERDIRNRTESDGFGHKSFDNEMRWNSSFGICIMFFGAATINC